MTHWLLSIFAQTFFHHRYGAHRMFTMSPGWERFFYLFSFVAQGPSFLIPRAYAILHREHHAFADTERDPHSPRFYRNVATMMWQTKGRYDGYAYHRVQPEARFDGDVPSWPLIDRLSQMWVTRLALGGFYVAFYLAFAPSAWWLLLLPVHFLMGPLHGAIVNWCGHRYGYRNFGLGDDSKNTLPFDFLTLGELFQNNHHKFGASPNFAVRWFEIDPCYQVMRVLSWVRVIDLGEPQVARFTPESAAESS
ncbi:MAG TPA: acyl-CoA desaturase [Kofleriaceae bacterium]|nr:acyl-CoA desaturase [Kofleriaceae bacterium]